MGRSKEKVGRSAVRINTGQAPEGGGMVFRRYFTRSLSSHGTLFPIGMHASGEVRINSENGK
jgi:hypothetical protein